MRPLNQSRFHGATCFTINFVRGCFLYIPVALLLLLVIYFQPFEDSSESWGYWFFSKILLNNFESVIIDRGPMYVAYLTFFSWLPYPANVDFAAFITIAFFLSAYVYFSSQFVPPAIGIVSIVIWLPYIRGAEPIAQFLGFGIVLLVAALRRRSTDHSLGAFWYTYPLLFSAYLCRPNLIIFLFLFSILDIRLFLSKEKQPCIQKLGEKSVFACLILGWMLIYVHEQSASAWNNVWFENSYWFPNDGKSLLNGGGIQSLNWMYNKLRTGNPEGADFYITNREIFGGESTYLGAVLRRPDLFGQILVDNVNELPPIITGQLWTPFMSRFDYPLLRSLLLCYVLVSAYLFAYDNRSLIIYWGSVIILASMVINVPKDRYVYPVIVLCMFSAIFSARCIYSYVSLHWPLFNFKYLADHQGDGDAIQFRSLTALIIIGLNMLYGGWNIRSEYPIIIKRALANDLSRPERSMRLAYPQLKYYSKQCRGIMSLESMFFAAHLTEAHQNIFSIFEIPPFGDLTHSDYRGLSLERVDCLFISYNLMTQVGAGTTVNTRYRDFIRPYEANLIAGGGSKVEIHNYGVFVRAPLSKEKSFEY